MKTPTLSIFLLVILSSSTLAQKDTVSVQGYYESAGSYGTLNDAIQTAKIAGTIDSTVFRLTPYDIYVLTGSIFIDHGESLDIWAPRAGTTQPSAPPQIVWTADCNMDGSVTAPDFNLWNANTTAGAASQVPEVSAPSPQWAWRNAAQRSIDEGRRTSVVDKFALHAGYPNPFNPSTTIAYDLPEAAEVRLTVFDGLGRRIEELGTWNLEHMP